MVQAKGSHCDSCGQIVDLAQFDHCPTCQYPVNPINEQQFLEQTIRDLQRVARYGGASLRVVELLRRYEGRLQFVDTLVASHSAAVLAEQADPGVAGFPVALNVQENCRQRPRDQADTL